MGLPEVFSQASAGGEADAGAGAGFWRSSRYACINCQNRSLVSVAEGVVAASAVAEGAVAAGAGAEGPGSAGVGAARAEPRAREPKSVSEAVKLPDPVDLQEPLGADSMDIAGADPLATP